MAETHPHTTVSSLPGDDVVLSSDKGGEVTLINAIRAYKKEAADAKLRRMRRNRENVEAYQGIQDWSHKQEGQSREFLPKVPVAVEQFVGFAKRALTQFGAWYEVELPRGSRSAISGTTIRSLMNCYLEHLMVADNVRSDFATQMTDTLKVSALESLGIIKIHGAMVNSRRFHVEPGDKTINEAGEQEDVPEQLVAVEQKAWNLKHSLVDPKKYYPDPTGNGLYEIHGDIEKDLHVVKQLAREGVYDMRAVKRIEEDFKETEDANKARSPHERGHTETIKPSFRKKVILDEFWGTIVNASGDILHENVLCTIANDKYVIRKPEPNPFWHGESPFVVIPLLRVPFSVWHKALMDHAVQINFAMNEIYNLVVDGGISAVWGIKQLRIDDLDDPGQVTDGVPQGATLAVKNSLPHGQKVLETVSEGQVPTDSMAVLEMMSREFAAAALSNEIKMGALPPKQVKATEVVELSQSQAITMDAIMGDVDRKIEKILELSWLTMLQSMDDMSSNEVIAAIGPKSALILGRMSPAQRFQMFANNRCAFKVHGLSSLLAKTRDFQKFMALLQVVMTNPLLGPIFFKKYSPDKILSHMMKMLSINPEMIEKDAAELNRLGADLQDMVQFANIQQGQRQGQGQGIAGQDVGEPGLPAEINSISNPSSGLAGVGGS
jgi:hypothetical protein